MITKIIEVTNNNQNWGKFLVMRPDTEWSRRSEIDLLNNTPLLRLVGWTQDHLAVMDLQTGEGAMFRIGGIASADLNKTKIWVCPMFEPFLTWLYKQDLKDLAALPDMVNLPDAPFEFRGYRRAGLLDELAQEQAENRRKLLASLSPEAREVAIKAFADLGLTQ